MIFIYCHKITPIILSDMDGNISSMKKTLRMFVKSTKADPHLAQDLLDATGWDLQAALTAYEGLNVTSTEGEELMYFVA